MGCGASSNSGSEAPASKDKRRKKDNSASGGAGGAKGKNGGEKALFRGVNEVEADEPAMPIAQRTKSTANNHHAVDNPLHPGAAASRPVVVEPQQQRAMSLAQVKSLQNPNHADVPAVVQASSGHPQPQQASAPLANPAAGAVSPASTPALTPAPEAATSKPASAVDPAAMGGSRKLTFRQSVHLALDLAKQQRIKYGKFRKDERRAVMELYEVLGLEEDKPLTQPSEFQSMLGCYRFPPPNMHMLREVETADGDTIEYMLGADEAKRRREAGTIRVDVRSTNATDAKRRVGVSGETTTSIKRNAFKSIPKTAQQTETLRSAMSNSVLFRGLDSRDLRLLFEAFEEEVVPADGIVFEKGDDGDRFYLIESGRCCILLDGGGDSSKTVDPLAQSVTGVSSRHALYVGDGDTFGELGVMYGTPRAATVVAVVETKLWFIDRDTYRGLLLVQTLRKRERYNRMLEAISLFQSLDEYEKTRIADVLETMEVPQGTVIVKEGDTGDSFYMIEEGDVQVSKSDVGVLSRLSPGAQGYFGELALLFDQRRAATVTALSPTVRLAVLSRVNFRNYLGPFEDILKRNTEQYKNLIERLQQQQQGARATTPSALS